MIEEGALADILLVNDDPLQHLELFNKPEDGIAMIVKNGVIYKDQTA